MNKPLISNDFTIEDIRKIREWHYEQRKSLGKQEYVRSLKISVSEFLKDMPQVKYCALPIKSYTLRNETSPHCHVFADNLMKICKKYSYCQRFETTYDGLSAYR